MRFRFQHTRGGCIGAIDIPSTAPGRVTVVAAGETKADALGRAALIAERIASDPVMSALMPPQALVAIQAAKALSAAAHQGPRALRHLWGSIRGEGKRRLAAALHAEAVKLDEHDEQHDVGWNPFHRKRKRRPQRPQRERDEQPDDGGGADDDGGADDAAPQSNTDRWKSEAASSGDADESAGDAADNSEGA